MPSYTKQKLLGSGAFGTVYLVVSNSQRKFALKEIKSGHLDAGCQKEINILRRLRHPLVVSYIESFVTRGDLCIIMEYCDWGDLHQLLDWKRSSKTRFSDHQILAFFCQIAVAVEYIHNQNVIHRDLKPKNVFLHKNMIKLGDFGVARQLSSRAELAHTVAGTPIYMSPEVLKNQPYTKKADIWSLGVLLYEMITLVTPFTSLWEVIQGRFKPLPSSVGENLKRLVLVMLQNDSGKRPSITSLISNSCLSKIILSDLDLRKIRRDPKSNCECSPREQCRSASSQPQAEKAEDRNALLSLLGELFK